MEYLESAVDTSELRQSMDDVIHFMTYKLDWDEVQQRFTLSVSRWASTDLNGINRILAGANPDLYLSKEDFLANAKKKGKEDGVLE